MNAKIKILLVEDHADMAEVMCELLGAYGYVVTLAGSVQQALSKSEGEAFDLLIADLSLPDGTGMDLMRKLRQSRPIRGICFTGYGDQYAQATREAGFDTYMTKPAMPEDIDRAIRQLLPAA